MLTTREQLSNVLRTGFTFFMVMQGVLHIGELWKPELALGRSDLSEYWIFFILAVIVGIGSRNSILPKRFATQVRLQSNSD